MAIYASLYGGYANKAQPNARKERKLERLREIAGNKDRDDSVKLRGRPSHVRAKIPSRTAAINSSGYGVPRLFYLQRRRSRSGRCASV